ncbi:MAG: ABC transporter substrate-binding protein [Cognatishimia sp.]|uniref:ABC transporter substrate-binding protein n=1 Tax=Cognatishimia sp. TaxID=2211648 RepID=UPI003B8B5597
MNKLTTIAAGAFLAATPALADLVIPDLSYRTGPYAAGGIPFSDGYQDYFTLLNERDGGIGGESVRIVECETGFNTEKGVECYEATKGEGALVYQPLSTGITYQLIPKATADGIPIHSMGYGRTSAKNGEVFRNVFNYPVNYWDGASIAVKHLLDENGGSLDGKKISLIYHNSGYGKEPIRTLEALAEKHGFTFKALAVDHPGQEQKSQWLQIRREKPDYVLMWGWGVMNQVAIQEAANIRFPMDKFLGVWWSGADHDVLPSGEKSNGYKALNFNGGGELPVLAEIQSMVADKGLAAGDGSNIGNVIYRRGLYAAMLAQLAIEKAQEIHGVSDITPAMMRDGMEALEVTNARMNELGAPNIGPEFAVSCDNHGGPGTAVVQQWDAANQSWNVITDFISSDADVIKPLIDEDSAGYADENNITASCS